MNALDAIGGKPLGHPVTGEVIQWDDLAAIKAALAETEEYVRRPEVRRLWAARDALQARLGELEPMTLPRRSQQTDKQRRVEICPRCRTRIEVSGSESEPQVEAVATSGHDLDAGSAVGPTLTASSDSDKSGPSAGGAERASSGTLPNAARPEEGVAAEPSSESPKGATA